MLEKDYLPIIAPIGLDKDYHTYNINADDAACAIAKAVHAEKLAFLTDIEQGYQRQVHLYLQTDSLRGRGTDPRRLHRRWHAAEVK